jgi:IS5 family transposase
VSRQAQKVCGGLVSGAIPIVGEVMRVVGAESELQHYLPLVQKVLAQTEARVFGGDSHYGGKVLSLFEEHSLAIRKGKMHKPTEFGRLVRLDEVENGIVSGYEVPDGALADTDSWEPALRQHQQRFGHAPNLATGDRGFSSAANERLAKGMGVKRVALPRRGPLSASRAIVQKERWFRRALRWRAGIERRISALKHPFGMLRAMYKGEVGFKRHVGWCVIANNLVSLARVVGRRRAEEKKVDGEQRKAA